MKRFIAALSALSVVAWMGGFLLFEGGAGIPVAHAWPPNAKVDYTSISGASRITSGDLDGDSDMDLVVTSSSSYVAVHLNNGDGTYATKVEYLAQSSGSGTYAKDVVIGDFNSDDEMDIAAIADNGSGGTSYIVIMPGYGDGTFPNWPSIYQTSWSTGETGTSLRAVDLNGDTNLDIVATNSYYTGNFTIGVFMGSGNGYFTGPTTYHSNSSDGPCSWFELENFTADSNEDIVCLGNSKITYWEGNGDGTFDARVAYSTGSAVRGISSGDIDGDTDRDVVVAFQSTGNVGVLLNNGSGVFGSVTTHAAGSPSAQMYGVTVADIDSDTNLDIIVPRHYIDSTFSYGTQIAVLLGNGDATFATAETVTVGSGPSGIITTTVNSDSYPDIVTANYAGNSISVLLNTVPPVETTATVTAAVETSASMSFGSNTISLGSMTANAVSGDDVALNITSNATNGYTIYLDDVNNNGYTDGSHTISMTTGTLTAGTEGAGWSVDVSGTNLAYNGGSCAGNYAVTDIGTTPFTAVVSTGPAEQVYNFCFAATTSSLTPAGNYAHTATVLFVANY